MRFSNFITDEKREDEGVWEPIHGPDGDTAELLVGRLGSNASQALFRRLREKRSRGFRGDSLPESVEDEIMIEVLSRTVLLDWRGLKDDDDQEIPYSPEKARELLRVKDFRAVVVQIASDADLYRAERTESGKKPSKK